MNIVTEARDAMRLECEKGGHVEPWFYPTHLAMVEKYTLALIEQLPPINNNALMLAVWLHDIARVRGLEGDHAAVGANEAMTFLLDKRFSAQSTTNLVVEAIRTHSCHIGLMPESPEAKILATADAMSHFGEFYLAVATTAGKSVEDFRTWALAKLDRDFHLKIHFDFAREQVKDRYRTIKQFIEMRG